MLSKVTTYKYHYFILVSTRQDWPRLTMPLKQDNIIKIRQLCPFHRIKIHFKKSQTNHNHSTTHAPVSSATCHRATPKTLPGGCLTIGGVSKAPQTDAWDLSKNWCYEVPSFKFVRGSYSYDFLSQS